METNAHSNYQAVILKLSENKSRITLIDIEHEIAGKESYSHRFQQCSPRDAVFLFLTDNLQEFKEKATEICHKFGVTASIEEANALSVNLKNYSQRSLSA